MRGRYNLNTRVIKFIFVACQFICISIKYSYPPSIFKEGNIYETWVKTSIIYLTHEKQEIIKNLFCLKLAKIGMI